MKERSEPGDGKKSTDGTQDREPVKRFFKALGPGLVTGAADDDPSGIATYSIAGAKLGTSMLWAAIVTWPLMACTQFMCARIGMVTGQGLAKTLKQKFPAWALVVMSVALLLANTINIAADLSGMADAAQMLTGLNGRVYVVIFAVAISAATVFFRYPQIARILKWLALVLFAYVVTAFLTKPDWKVVLHDTFLPKFSGGHETWSMLVAILGTTISPYLFVWQSSQEVEEMKAKGEKTLESRKNATASELHDRKLDVGTGTFFSNLVMFFIILASSQTLHKTGNPDIETSKQAAEALKPLAGNFAYLLYTVGLLGVGFLAIPTLAGASAYAFAETFSWRHGLDEKFKRARSFYAVVVISTLIAGALVFTGINPMKALIWSATINGVLAPLVMTAILAVACDRKIMNDQPSSKLSLLVVSLATLAMYAAVAGLFL
jgi:NRAMP (natural resistance-associated macrophage protein)-like metal ion transporter